MPISTQSSVTTINITNTTYKVNSSSWFQATESERNKFFLNSTTVTITTTTRFHMFTVSDHSSQNITTTTNSSPFPMQQSLGPENPSPSKQNVSSTEQATERNQQMKTNSDNCCFVKYSEKSLLFREKPRADAGHSLQICWSANEQQTHNHGAVKWICVHEHTDYGPLGY